MLAISSWSYLGQIVSTSTTNANAKKVLTDNTPTASYYSPLTV